MKKITSLLLSLLLSFSLILLPSCGEDEASEDEATPWDEAKYDKDTELGTGSKTFTLEVCAYDKTVKFTVKTDKSTLGDALLELGLIEGDEGPYGLYVKKVNGILADYDEDQTYWALYIDGEYATTGVDTTEAVSGTVYKLSREK